MLGRQLMLKPVTRTTLLPPPKVENMKWPVRIAGAPFGTGKVGDQHAPCCHDRIADGVEVVAGNGAAAVLGDEDRVLSDAGVPRLNVDDSFGSDAAAAIDEADEAVGGGAEIERADPVGRERDVGPLICRVRGDLESAGAGKAGRNELERAERGLHHRVHAGDLVRVDRARHDLTDGVVAKGGEEEHVAGPVGKAAVDLSALA